MSETTIQIFGLTFNIDPVAFKIGGWSVYWYGIIIAEGVFLALLYGMKRADRFGMNEGHFFNSFIVVLPCSILGARAYYIIFDSNQGFSDFFNFKGHGFAGLAIYGGVIAAAITVFIMQRIYKFSFLSALDIASVGFLIGQGIGRWGNFVNQEAYGTFTGSDWFGMTGGEIAREMHSTALVHPCFLYESIWCIAGFFLLNHFSKKRLFKGQIALMYGVWYGFERAIVETLRTDSLMLGDIRVSSLLSALLCVSCFVALIVIIKKKKEAKQALAYESQFGDAAAAEIKVNEDETEPENEAEIKSDSADKAPKDETAWEPENTEE